MVDSTWGERGERNQGFSLGDAAGGGTTAWKREEGKRKEGKVYVFYDLKKKKSQTAPRGLVGSVSWPGTEPRTLAVKAQTPNHWTTREFLRDRFMEKMSFGMVEFEKLIGQK